MFKHLILGVVITLCSIKQFQYNDCSYARTDHHALSCAIYFEARGQSLKDKKAVAFVAINRAEKDSYPSTVRKVVYQEGQFSWTNLPNTLLIPKEKKEWQEAQRIARLALDERLDDPTNGQIYFSKRKMKYMKRVTLKTGVHYYGK